MSFGNITEASAVMVEYTKSTSQTVSSGDVIVFDTKRSTGSDGTSVDSSTGVISLSGARNYWVQASLAVTMSTNGSYEATFQDSAGNTLSESDGVFPAYHTITYPDNFNNSYINHSYMGSLIVDNPTLDYKLVITAVPAGSTVLVETHLFIMELV